MPEKQSDIATRKEQAPTRRQSVGARPFRMLERVADELDRLSEEFGLGRRWSRPAGMSDVLWSPDIEVSQRNTELVVRADLPGMTKDDITVEVTDEAIAIQGERHREHEEERGGMYRSERSYGRFYRAIPLPEGAMPDQAKATFKDGVLEITMPAPPEQVTRGRRLTITEGAARPRP